MKPVAQIADWIRQNRRKRHTTAERALARRGEDLAHRFLEGKGCRVVARNYRTPSGGNEVDIIVWQGDRLAFVEVKTRTGDISSAPERAVNEEKQRRIIRAARDYTRKAKMDLSIARFDVVAIVDGRPPVIEWYPDAFGVPRPLW